MATRKKGRSAIGLVIIGAAAWLTSTAPAMIATAAPLDLHFQNFYDPSKTGAEKVDSGGFSLLMRELSLVMGPRMSGPAASMGMLGMEVAYELSFAGVHSEAKYWVDAADKPQGTVRSGQLRVRKGLPFGLQTGASLTHLFDSNMWAIGAEGHIALVDGFRNLPDFGVRANLNSLLGNPNLSMLMLSTDFVLSKSFGIGGVLSLQPWAAYSFGFTMASAHQIDVFVNDADIMPETLILRNINEFSHRAVFGLRIVATRLSIGGEFMRSFTDNLNVVTGKVGIDF